MVPIAIGNAEKKGAEIVKRLFHINYNYKFKHTLRYNYKFRQALRRILKIAYGNRKIHRPYSIDSE